MADWIGCTLGDVLTLQRGHDLPKAEMIEGDIPVAGSNGIIGWHNTATTKAVGVTIGRSGNLGNAYLHKKDFWAHNTTLYVKDFKGNDPTFSYHFLKTIDFKQFNVGSAVPTLNRNHVHPLEIQWPKEPKEQKTIAEVLSSLDDKIDLLHRQNKTLESLAETLFRHWFIDGAQDDWEWKPLGDMVETMSGGTPSRKNMAFYIDGSIPWIKSKELNGSFIQETEESITEDALKASSAKLIPKHSVLLAMYGATVGEYALTSKVMTCNQAICAILPNQKFPYTFLFLWLKNLKEEIVNMAVGSAQQNISQIAIKRLLVPDVPDKLSEFHSKALTLFEKIETNVRQIQKLEDFRDTLLPKLMSGDVRVDYEAAA
jgi:type I restriction enzyme S subunit